jgi:hypothetical protein
MGKAILKEVNGTVPACGSASRSREQEAMIESKLHSASAAEERILDKHFALLGRLFHQAIGNEKVEEFLHEREIALLLGMINETLREVAQKEKQKENRVRSIEKGEQ